MPYELVHASKSDLSDLPEWGAKLFVLKEDHGKLESKSDEGKWVGYSNESKGHRVYWPGKRRITIEHNVTFDAQILVTPTDALTEGVPTTQGSQHVSGLQGQPPPPPEPAPATDPAGIDPLEGFEDAVPPADTLQGRGHRTRKPSAYVWGIAEGVGSSTGHPNAPVYPQGLPMPTHSSALVALTELEEGISSAGRGTRRPFEIAMAAAMHTAGSDPISLSDACSRDDWP
jgi:hypothetical protein